MSSPTQKSTVEAQPLIAVRNVRASSRWYAELLGADPLPDHSHRDVYDRIWRAGRLLLQLHAWDAEEHLNLVGADAAPPDHGVLLWFQVDDFDSVVERARRLGAEIIEEPHINPAPRHREIGFAMPMGMSWWSPVRTANAFPNLDSGYGSALVTRRSVKLILPP
jgi:catechol 2,3-dioxygenase-like lactoylglutathione lyase family enzyme